MSIFSNATGSLIKNINNFFGDEVVYTYKAGGTSTISAVFENAYVEVLGVTSLKPILKNVQLTDLTSTPVKGDSVTINAVAYRVVDPQLDGNGSCLLILEKT